MKFRFTADHFKYGSYTNPETGLQTSYCFADCQAEGVAERANALLDAEEAKCERVYAYTLQGPWDKWYRYNELDPQTHQARLWNVEKIGECVCGETSTRNCPVHGNEEGEK